VISACSTTVPGLHSFRSLWLLLCLAHSSSNQSIQCVSLSLLPRNCVTSTTHYRATKHLISHSSADLLVLVEPASKQSQGPVIQEQTFSTQSRTFHTLWLAGWPSSRFAAVKRSGNQSAIQMPRSQQHRSIIVPSRQTNPKDLVGGIVPPLHLLTWSPFSGASEANAEVHTQSLMLLVAPLISRICSVVYHKWNQLVLRTCGTQFLIRSYQSRT
jgi:hypothetical protein